MNIIAGTIGAVFLQSSTAVALLVSGFAATGVMGVTGSLAVVLGADLGTAIVVQFLSLDLAGFIPVLMAVGGIMFLRFDAREVKQLGRVLMGIAFILLSLKMIGEATNPIRESQYLPAIVQFLSEDPFSAFIGGTLIAFVFHSSVAAILLFATFCGLGILPIDAAISLALGANVGGGLVAVWLTRGSHVKARRITMGNLIFRTLAAVIVLVALQQTDVPLDRLGSSTARQLVNFHLIFNAVLVLICLPFIIPLATLMKRWIVDPIDADNGTMKPVSALDRKVLATPGLALASATRELLRMSEQIEVMLTPLMDFFDTSNPQEVSRVQQMDKHVNEAHTDIKLYLAELHQGQLTPEQSTRSMDLTNFAISLERVGDIIVKDLLRLTDVKHKNNLSFSEDGWNELTSLHARVMANMQLALNVLVSEDLDSARQLVEEKAKMRKLEQESHDRHIERLGKGTQDSIATSNIHLEIVRGLKEINSRFATFAYPILSKNGVLLESRLAEKVPIL